MNNCRRYTVHCVGIDKAGNVQYTTNGNEGECTGQIGNCGCKHAEVALLEQMPSPVSVVLSLSPCINCADKLIKAGVQYVAYAQEYRIRDGIELLEDAGVVVKNLSEEVA